MSPKRTIVLALALCTSGIAAAQAKQAPTMWDEAAAKEARAVVDRGLAAIEKMDIEAFKAVAAADLTAYDIDLESKPVRMKSMAECTKYMEAIIDGAKKMGAALKFENRTTDCRATATVAYCAMEYDFVATMADGSKATQPSQTTAILRKGDDGWKWVHWHTSLSASPTTTAAPSGK